MKLYPLTKPQQSIWNMEQFYGGSIACITGSAIFDNSVDKNVKERACTLFSCYHGINCKKHL